MRRTIVASAALAVLLAIAAAGIVPQADARRTPQQQVQRKANAFSQNACERDSWCRGWRTRRCYQYAQYKWACKLINLMYNRQDGHYRCTRVIQFLRVGSSGVYAWNQGAWGPWRCY